MSKLSPYNVLFPAFCKPFLIFWATPFPADVPGSIALQYTPLVPSATHPFYYNVKMLSLAVDGQLLPVSQVGRFRPKTEPAAKSEGYCVAVASGFVLLATSCLPWPPSCLQSLFDQGYGTVLDSGTTFTYMPTPVFRAFASGEQALCCCSPVLEQPACIFTCHCFPCAFHPYHAFHASASHTQPCSR